MGEMQSFRCLNQAVGFPQCMKRFQVTNFQHYGDLMQAARRAGYSDKVWACIMKRANGRECRAGWGVCRGLCDIGASFTRVDKAALLSTLLS
ncbi:hypothetical protein GCM10009304_14650 [Pseudomonas matsuisoli]|uniref:Uncharacterized protein n=1 Tax=Pseudomonas matsuisoli TaxID=1515666 RepID=A0A917UWB1_9PSED|nr:hypothetical protein GCM10009304_14650 [Pseudomonas matsuisoli]